MKIIKKEWPFLIWCFMVFSFCGWLYELGWEIYLGHGFVNRGSLNLCYIPVYGVGGLMLMMCLKDIVFHKKKVKILGISITPIVVFVATVLIATFVEYVASCIIEDLFNIRFWDYSTTPYNLNGRIALKNSIIFGIIGVFGMYGVIPLIRMFLNYIGRKAACVFAVCMITIFFLDCALVAMGYKLI